MLKTAKYYYENNKGRLKSNPEVHREIYAVKAMIKRENME